MSTEARTARDYAKKLHDQRWTWADCEDCSFIEQAEAVFAEALGDRAALVERVLAALDNPVLIERLAAWEHDEHWAGWEEYRDEKAGSLHPSGEPYLDRWKRQRRTPYAYLTETEKKSDRTEVQNYLVIIRDAIRAVLLAPDAATGHQVDR